MVARCCNALGRLPVRGLGPRLRRTGTWVRIFLAGDLRVHKSLLIGLCFINLVSTLMLENLLNICVPPTCLITTKPNFAIIIDRDLVMHHKI